MKILAGGLSPCPGFSSYGEDRTGNMQPNASYPGTSCTWQLEVVGGGRLTGVCGDGRVTQDGALQPRGFLDRASKEVLSRLSRVIDFRVFAVMHPEESDTRVLKTGL